MRRIVYRHTAGPYPGLHQILALELRGEGGTGALFYLHTGEQRALEPGPLPDRLAPIPMCPDGRMAKGMRLKTSDKWVLYQEVPDGA
jgi:hypothetical protein